MKPTGLDIPSGSPWKHVQLNDFEALESAIMLTMNDEEKVTVGDNDIEYVPVTFDRCDHIKGPFYHGTKSALEIGDQLVRYSCRILAKTHQ